MLRTILWLLLAAYLIAVGLWHGAAAPASLAFAGLAVLIGLVPAYVWVLAAGVIWWRHRRTVVIQPATA
jgi:hypothetical protein